MTLHVMALLALTKHGKMLPVINRQLCQNTWRHQSLSNCDPIQCLLLHLYDPGCRTLLQLALVQGHTIAQMVSQSSLAFSQFSQLLGWLLGSSIDLWPSRRGGEGGEAKKGQMVGRGKVAKIWKATRSCSDASLTIFLAVTVACLDSLTSFGTVSLSHWNLTRIGIKPRTAVKIEYYSSILL